MASRTPTAATPLPKSSVAPESPSRDANTDLNTNASLSPQTVPFPPPQTFEIIPQLHGILLRLLSQRPAGNAAVGGPGDGTEVADTSAEAQRDGQQPSLNIPGGENNNSSSSNNNNNSNTNSNEHVASQPITGTTHPPLDVKNLPTETHSVKIRIQKARAVVEGLPDVQRSVEEQQHEISELEDRVARLRSVISHFGTRAGQDPADEPRVTAV